jgi:hypothetical protein
MLSCSDRKKKLESGGGGAPEQNGQLSRLSCTPDLLQNTKLSCSSLGEAKREVYAHKGVKSLVTYWPLVTKKFPIILGTLIGGNFGLFLEWD